MAPPLSFGIDVRRDARRDGAVGVFERVELSSEGPDLLIDIAGLFVIRGGFGGGSGATTCGRAFRMSGTSCAGVFFDFAFFPVAPGSHV